ncbi:MAG: adenine/guanine/hypoxanthine permease [Mycobacterium sp.]|jgi:AGZA family xanthine/uracil permease-like MFS transporter|nr:adenine/guanine/hypoxanthine permease [Mycobacterium sp.]
MHDQQRIVGRTRTGSRRTRGDAALSFIRLIHAPEGAWAANPAVALGYLFFGLVCVLYWFLPGAKDPVVVDEADVVAGH